MARMSWVSALAANVVVALALPVSAVAAPVADVPLTVHCSNGKSYSILPPDSGHFTPATALNSTTRLVPFAVGFEITHALVGSDAESEVVFGPVWVHKGGHAAPSQLRLTTCSFLLSAEVVRIGDDTYLQQTWALLQVVVTGSQGRAESSGRG